MKEHVVRSLADIFAASSPIVQKKSRATDRGELLKYFATRMGWSIGRVAGKVAHLKEVKDLYYLKSICDSYEREGKGPWAKCFNGALKKRA